MIIITIIITIVIIYKGPTIDKHWVLVKVIEIKMSGQSAVLKRSRLLCFVVNARKVFHILIALVLNVLIFQVFQ